MSTLLITHADVLVTMDDAGTEIADGAIFARDGVIEAIGPSHALPTAADTVLNLRGHVVAPGQIGRAHV